MLQTEPSRGTVLDVVPSEAVHLEMCCVTLLSTLTIRSYMIVVVFCLAVTQRLRTIAQS